MSKLYDACQRLIQAIDEQGLDPFKARGAIALETGFLISTVSADGADEPEKLQALRDAAKQLYGIDLPA